MDVVCFAKLKRELADEIRNWNDWHQRGIQKRDFAGVFGRAYLRAFTPELVKSAWKAVGIHPYNPDIIPLDKLAPSEASTTLLTTASAIHSTPVRKVMSVFSYFDASLGHGDSRNNDNSNDGGGNGHNNNSSNDGHDNSDGEGSDDERDDPFLPPFTPRSRMHILHRSFASDLSTSYLVSKEPVNSSLNLIKPIHEKPYFTEEPDWSLISKPTTCHLDQLPHEELLERCRTLEIALD